MARKVLEYDGVAYLWEKIKSALLGKVDKETGKGLSSNDYTAAEKAKLANIAAGAQVNVLEGVQVNGQSVSPVNKISNIPVPTKTSDLTNDRGFVTSTTMEDALDDKVDKETGKGLSSNDYTAAEKTKLSGIASGAQVNVLEGIKVNGQAISPVSKVSNITVPTKTSDITNDSGFITADDIPEGAVATTTTPKMDGTAAVGTETKFARGDHVHPSDTKKANLASPTFTGTPAAPTAAAGTNTTQLATTAFVQSAVAGKANLASPAFTGTPTAPTAAAGTNTTQLATTAFVRAAIDAAQVGAAMFQGTVSAGTDISGLTNYKKGYYWVVATAGTYVGQTCEVGDMIFAIADYSSSYKTSDFSVIQNNLDIAAITNAELDVICV